MPKSIETNRREFLRWSAATGIAGTAATVAPGAYAADVALPFTVQSYHRLGRTELEISDISMGTSNLRTGQENLVHFALDKGINYFDSAHGYTRGQSETTLGNALKGMREDVYIVSKAVTDADESVDSLMDRLETSLRRLQTDYVDVYMCHAVNEVERLSSESWNEFITRAKEQGKIRFSGVSGHAGYLDRCLTYTFDQDMADVILVAYNFGEDPAFYEKLVKRFDMVALQPKLPSLLERAKELDVGVTVMKTLRGARLNDMRAYETANGTFAQAALRWVLTNQNVDAAVITMSSEPQIVEFLGASGSERLEASDLQLLDQYAALNSNTYCRPLCNDCYSACPYNVEVGEVLRTRMYAVDYGDIPFARDEYDMLKSNASACVSCDGSPCRNACTYGLNIAELCDSTHELLA
ncbi:MAG: aldo/keto reductase [Pseudomonadales bacterium]|nr:aldo/keto reductase [Pseudomonadales bacterium]